LILRGTRRAEIGKRVRSVLERMGLGHREKALPTQLSAGEQQRVGIARAIIAEPPLLVADAPTGNLDPTLDAEIMALFAGLPERDARVLVVSHALAALKRMRKRVLVLEHGRLADDISPKDLAEWAPRRRRPPPPRPRASACGSTSTCTAWPSAPAAPR